MQEGMGFYLRAKTNKMADNNPSRIKCYEEAAQLEALRLPESSGRTCRLLGHKAGAMAQVSHLTA